MRNLKKNSICSKPVAECIDYIYDHLHTRITVELLAKRVNLTPSYLSRLFKKETEIISEEELDRDELAKVVAQTGYELKGIESGPFEMKKGLFGFIKKK